MEKETVYEELVESLQNLTSIKIIFSDESYYLNTMNSMQPLIKDAEIVKNAFETAHIEVSPYGFVYKGIQIDMGELSKRLLNMGIVQLPEILTITSDTSTLYFLNLNRLSAIIPFDDFERIYCNGICSFRNALFSYLGDIAGEEFDSKVCLCR